MKVSQSQVLILFLIIAYGLLSENAAALLLFFAFMLSLGTTRVTLKTLKRLGLFPYLALIIVSAISTIALSPFAFNPYYIGRDLFYFLAPITMLFIGFALGKREPDINRLIWATVLSLTFLSVLTYSEYWLSGGLLSFSTAGRYAFGLESKFATLALIILVTYSQEKKPLAAQWIVRAVLFLNAYMLLQSFSRTNLAIIIVVLALRLIRRKYTRIFIVMFVILMITLPMILGLFGKDVMALGESVGFLDTVLNSFTEVSIKDYTTAGQQNEYWRGYEAFLGVNAVLSNGWPSTLFGLGLGSFVNGPFLEKLNVIPVFHNGFVTFFIKGGLVGLLLFSLFLFRLYIFVPGKTKLSQLPDKSVFNLWKTLTSFMVLSIAIDTISTHGILYTKTLIELLVIGLLQGALSRYDAQYFQHLPPGRKTHHKEKGTV